MVRNFYWGREKNVVRNFGETIQTLNFWQSVLVFGVSCDRISSPLRNDHDHVFVIKINIRVTDIKCIKEL